MFGKHHSLIYDKLGVLTKHGYDYLIWLLEGISTVGVFFKFGLDAGRNIFSSCFQDLVTGRNT